MCDVLPCVRACVQFMESHLLPFSLMEQFLFSTISWRQKTLKGHMDAFVHISCNTRERNSSEPGTFVDTLITYPVTDVHFSILNIFQDDNTLISRLVRGSGKLPPTSPVIHREEVHETLEPLSSLDKNIINRIMKLTSRCSRRQRTPWGCPYIRLHNFIRSSSLCLSLHYWRPFEMSGDRKG